MRTSSSVMDPQFQELADAIADAVQKRLAGEFDERIATRVEERLSGAFEERIVTKLEERLSGTFEERIKKHIDEFENRAEARMKMHFENLEGTVKLAADGYGGTLDGIKRELEDLNKKVDTKLGDHDLVLRNHNDRIVKLEERR